MEDPSFRDLLAKRENLSLGNLLQFTRSLVSRGIQMPSLLFDKTSGLLVSKGSSLGDERWSLIERILLAAIKLNVEPWIGYCLKELRQKFPGSTRVQKLVGIYKEALEDWSEAEIIYKGILVNHPDDIYVRKRMITCLKAQGRVGDAISATIDQLEVFSSDSELWHELTMLYASECSFTKAVGASEELLLSDPTNFYNILVHAELVLSSGDPTLARKYFCKSLQLRPEEPRALWGLLVCLVETKDESRLLSETRARIERIYASNDSMDRRAVRSLLSKIGVA